MKTKILLFVSLVLLAVQGWAAPVDESAARTIVQDFVIEKRNIYPNSVPTSGGSDLQLLHAEMSSVSVTMNAYYIFNTGDGFVIVAGDDRAEQILGYGDGDFDMNDIPCCMQFMLDSYKEQIDYLLEHPGLEVETPSMNAPRLSASNVAPMLTAKWGQRKPYYNLTPVYNGTHCKTGCCCVALCQLMHYWRYPTTAVPSLRAYTTLPLNIFVPELPSDRFHWNYIKDSYSGSYTDDEAYSVAKLMRYVGQAEHIYYTPDGSGAATWQILDAAIMFGYNRNAKILDRDDYTDAEWAALIQAELNVGRPIVYSGFNSSLSVGHAFNIDGYRASDKKYHINWGFNGNSNGYYALNAFNPPNNNFNYMQDMIVGLMPQGPEIVVTPTSLSLSASTGESKIATFIVKGYALTGNLTVKLNNGGNIYSIDKNIITMSDAAYGDTVKVTYNPTEVGTSSASVTISGGGATAKTVSLSGSSSTGSSINVNPSSLSFNSIVGETKTATFIVKCPNAIGNLSLKLNGGGNIYSIDKTSISKIYANIGATVTVTFSPSEVGTSSANITISGGGANPKTVPLSGTAFPASTIKVNPSSLSFNSVVGETKTATFTVKCPDAIGNLSLKLNNGGNIYSIDKTSISKNNAINGATVTVTYKPSVRGTSSASVTISGGGANPETVSLSGTAIKPEITVDPTSLSFSAITGETQIDSIYVKGTDLTGDLAVILNNGNDTYSLDKTSITKSEALNGIRIKVTYKPTELGASNASVTISGGSAESKTVSLSGTAIKPEITVDPMSLSFSAIVGETKTTTFFVKGTNLTGKLHIELNNGGNRFFIDQTEIPMSVARRGTTVTVTYCPIYAEMNRASITISGGSADPVTVTLSGSAIEPQFTVSPEILSFNTYAGKSVSHAFNITGFVNSDLALTLHDDSGSYSIDKTIITPSEVAGCASVTVTYNPTADESHNASVTISGGGADPKTVILEGNVIAPPIINTNVSELQFGSAYTGYESARGITITCDNLIGNLQLSISHDHGNSYGLSDWTITPEAAAAGSNVIVYFTPTSGGNKTATLNISSDGVETVSIPLNGTGIKSDGYIFAMPTNLSFETQAGIPVTEIFKVTYTYPNGSVMISKVNSDDETAFDSEGSIESVPPTFNAFSHFSDLTRTKIPFDSIIWRPKVIIDSLPLVLVKSLVLELTGDDCFDITPKRIRLSSIPSSTYVTVTYHPDCIGEHDGNIKIWLFGGSARPFFLPLHGTATAQFNYDNEGNDLMITQNETSINTLVNEMLTNTKVYAEGLNIIIESPVEQRANISDIAGHVREANLQAGRNVIPVNSSGIYIVRIREKTTKLMLK